MLVILRKERGEIMWQWSQVLHRCLDLVVENFNFQKSEFDLSSLCYSKSVHFMSRQTTLKNGLERKVALPSSFVRLSSVLRYFLKLVSDQFQGTGESHPQQRDRKNQVFQGDTHCTGGTGNSAVPASACSDQTRLGLCLCIRLILSA